jgi:hypothetical protein
MKTDFSSSLAADMDKALVENKDMFAQAAVLEKLAFTRVADEDKVVSEIEIELNEKADAELAKTEAEVKPDLTKKASAPSVMDSVNALLKVSEDLDNAGFDKFAAASIMLATKLVEAAKGKSKSKSESKSEKAKDKSKSKDKSKDKSKSSKTMSKADRMKKLREMGKGKKKVSKAQQVEQRPTEVVMHETPRTQPNPAAPAPQAPQPGKASSDKAVEPSKLEASLKQRFQAAHPDTFAALQWQQFTVSPSATTPGAFDIVAKVAVAPKGAQHMAQVAKSAPGGSISNVVKQVLEGLAGKGSKVSVMTVPYSTGGAK